MEVQSRSIERPQLEQIAGLQDGAMHADAVEKCAVAAIPIHDNIGTILHED